MIASKPVRRNHPSPIAPRAAGIPEIDGEPALDDALRALCEIDPLMARLLAIAGRPPLRRRPPAFAGLVSIVVSQQLSTASAAAIFGRLETTLGALTPAAIVASDDGVLRACGLSTGKIATLRACAAAVSAGALDLDRLRLDQADAAEASLTAIRGIGPWTADVFLLFCLGHADAWPAGDLALQEAVRLALDWPTLPDARTMIAIGARWQPLRAVAARVLWAFYGHIKRRNVAPDGGVAAAGDAP